MPYKDPDKAREAKRRSAAKRRAKKRAEAAKVAPLPPPPEPPKPKPRLWLTTGATPGDVLGDWAEACLIVPTGPLQGRPFKVPAWQREWLTAALAPAIGEAGLSIARKNGKSGVIAAYFLACLDGPMSKPHWRGVVASLTGELAKELRHAVEGTAEASGIGSLDVRLSPSPGHILGPEGRRLDFLNAEKASGHALGADVAVLDEAGLLMENKRGLWNALASCVSGRDGRLLAVSIRGEGPMFSEMASRADDPAVHWTEYAAAPDAALDDPKAWADANPGLADGIKSLEYMKRRSRLVLTSPADQSFFKAHDLNQPQEPDRETIVAAREWLECVVDVADLPPREGAAFVGFDLGKSRSMSAFVAYWPLTARMDVYAALPEIPGLKERGAADGAGEFYIGAHGRGELWTYPGRETPNAQFLADCFKRIEGETVTAMGADRYQADRAKAAFRETGVNWRIEWRGTGAGATRDGTHDVIAFQRAVLGGRIKATGTLMSHAVQASALRYDVGGNPALDKAKQRDRIDCLQAGVIAAGLAAKYGVSRQLTVRIV